MCIADCLNLVKKYFGNIMKPFGLLGGSSLANPKNNLLSPFFSENNLSTSILSNIFANKNLESKGLIFGLQLLTFKLKYIPSLVFIVLISSIAIPTEAMAWNIYVQMHNIPGASYAPGTNGTITVEGGVSKKTSSAGGANITIPGAGTYNFLIYNYNKTAKVTEYWGYQTKTYTGFPTGTTNIYRVMPYASGVTFSNPVPTSLNSITSSTITVTKPAAYPPGYIMSNQTVKMRIRLKGTTAYGTTYGPVTVVNGKATLSNIALAKEGQYEYILYVYTTYGNWKQAINALTDSWAWTNGPKVTIPRYTVGASVTGGTAIRKSITVTSGSPASFTITPDAYHSTAGAKVTGSCGAGRWSGNTYTISSVTAGCSSINFQLKVIKGGFGYTIKTPYLQSLNGSWKVVTYSGGTTDTVTTGNRTTINGKISLFSNPISVPGTYTQKYYFTANDGVTPPVTEYWGSTTKNLSLGSPTTIAFTRNMPVISKILSSATKINSTQTVSLTPSVLNNSGISRTMRVTVRLLDTNNKVLTIKSSAQKVVPVKTGTLTTMPAVTFGPLKPGAYKRVYILENWMNNRWQPVDHGAPFQFLNVTAPNIQITNPGNPNLNGTWTVDYRNAANALAASNLKAASTTNGIQTLSVPSLTAGNYSYKVYFKANDRFVPQVNEYWGKGNLLAPAAKSPVLFRRYMPWIGSAVKAINASVVTGGNATISLPVVNNDQIQHRVQCKAEVVNGATVLTSVWTNNLTVPGNGGTGSCSIGFNNLTAAGSYSVKYWVRTVDAGNAITDHGGPRANVFNVHVPKPSATVTKVLVKPAVTNPAGRINAGRSFSIDAVVTNNGQTNQSFWVGASLLDPNGKVVADYPPVPTGLLQQPTSTGVHAWPAAGGQPIMKNLMVPAANSVTGNYTVRVAAWNAKPRVGLVQTPLASTNIPLAVSAVLEQQVKLTANGPTYIIPIGSGGKLDALGNPNWTAIPQKDFYVKDAATGAEIQLTNAVTAKDGAKLYSMSQTLNWLMTMSFLDLNNEISTLSYNADQKFGQIRNNQSWQAGKSAIISFTSGTAISWSAGISVCGAGAFFTAGTSCAVGAVIGTVGTAISVIDSIASAADEYRTSSSILNQNKVGLLNGRAYMNEGFKLMLGVEGDINLYKVGHAPDYSSLYDDFHKATQGMSFYQTAASKFSQVGLTNTFALKRYTKSAVLGAIPLASYVSAIKNYVDNGMPTAQLASLVAKDMATERARLDKVDVFGATQQVQYEKALAAAWNKNATPNKPLSLALTVKPIVGNAGDYQITAIVSGATIGEIKSYTFDYGDGHAQFNVMSPPNVAVNVVSHTYLTVNTYPIKVTAVLTDNRSVVKTSQIVVTQVSIAPILTSIKIQGSGILDEGTTIPLSAVATFSDNTTQVVTPTWTVNTPAKVASISAVGALSAGQVSGNKIVDVSAKYSVGNITVYTSKPVVINDLNLPLVDNILPTVVSPANITVNASTKAGVPATAPAIVAFLGGATATDNVGVVGAVTNNAPTMFPAGTTLVTFSAKDAANNIGKAQASVTVVVPNAQPVLTLNAGLITPEDTPVVISNTALKTTDADNTPAQLTYTLKTVSANGVISRMGVPLLQGGIFTQADVDAGIIKYSPNLNYNGLNDGFFFTVSDGVATLPQAQFKIKVTPVNDPPAPTATAMASVVSNGSSTTSQVSPNDPDVGDTHTFKVTGPPAKGQAKVSGTGLVTYTPNVGAGGKDQIAVTVYDKALAHGFVKINVSITVPLDTVPPVIKLIGKPLMTIKQGQLYKDAGATATDNVDGNLTNRIVINNPVNTSVIGTYTVTYNVKDAAGNPAKQIARTVKVVSPSTTAVTIAKLSAAAGGTISVPVDISPGSGSRVRSFNLTASYNGKQLTAGKPVYKGLPASWSCSSTMIPPSPAGLQGVQMVCSTLVAADALTAPVTAVRLPVTVSGSVPTGTVLAVSLSGNSKVYDGGNVALQTALTNGSVTVNNNSVSYTLTPGWNLVSFPLNFGATGLTDFLAKAPAVSAVWTYKGGLWQSYRVVVPSFMNTLYAIQPGVGYWVKSNTNATVTMTGSPAPALVVPAYKPGWHLVGTLTPVSNVAGYLKTHGASAIWGYGDGKWCSNLTTVPAFMNCLKTIQREAGYFIKTP